MNKLTIAAQTIKDRVSALDVGNALGLNVDKHGRCSCPFHNGKDRNMKLFPGNRGYSCFVCHASGDVIRFVQEYNGCTFKEAVNWLNNAFNLGMDISSPMSPDERKRAKFAQWHRKNEQEFRAWKDRFGFDMALLADDIVRILENIRDEKRPRTYGEWDPDFCTAVEMLPEARQFAEDCMMECMKEAHLNEHDELR